VDVTKITILAECLLVYSNWSRRQEENMWSSLFGPGALHRVARGQVRNRLSFARSGACLGFAFLAAAALGTASTASRAANANFEVIVVPVGASASSPASVSVSRSGLTTYAAYKVSITNSSGNTNNAIRFDASSVVTGDLTALNADAGAMAPYVEAIGTQACTGTGSSVTCSFPQMKAGANNSFVLIFSAPPLAAANQWAANAAIALGWSFDYASGNSSSTPSSILCNGVQVPSPPCTGSEAIALVTTVTDSILAGFTTYIPSFGGTFFTGSGSVLPPSGTNLRPTAAVKLAVPPGQNLTTAQVDVTVTLGGATGDTTTTNTAIVQVPNNDQLFRTFATIELRRDASTIAKGAKIANAVVSYSHYDDGRDLGPLSACPANGVPTAVSPVCVFSRTEFTKKNAPTADDVGDWQFILHALENGVSRW
jgi:hypothetical protein